MRYILQAWAIYGFVAFILHALALSLPTEDTVAILMSWLKGGALASLAAVGVGVMIKKG